MSELRLSALCDRARLDDAVLALHRAFGLHEPPRGILPAGQLSGRRRWRGLRNLGRFIVQIQ